MVVERKPAYIGLTMVIDVSSRGPEGDEDDKRMMQVDSIIEEQSVSLMWERVLSRRQAGAAITEAWEERVFA